MHHDAPIRLILVGRRLLQSSTKGMALRVALVGQSLLVGFWARGLGMSFTIGWS
jgi:hypothetical protein